MASFDDTLFEAAKKGYVDDMKELVKAKGNFNIHDSLHNTPLHYAAGFGHAECVRLLLTAPGIKATLQNNVGDTALHKAAVGRTEGHGDAATLLAATVPALLTVKNSHGEIAHAICLNGAKGSLIAGGGSVAGFNPDELDLTDSDDKDDDDDD